MAISVAPPQPPKLAFPAGLRLAVPGDESRVFDLCLAAHADNGLAGMSRAKVWRMIDRIIIDQQGAIAIAPGPERFEAGVLLEVMSMWYSDDFQYWEQFLFVHPAHRRAGHAQRLLQFIQWWAQETGSPVVFGVGSTKRLAAKARLYSRYGTPIGAMFIAGDLHKTRPTEMAA